MPADSELAHRSGVPVATIKSYLREGLLWPGAATSATQASYGEEHLQRLRLIRLLRDIGQLSVATVSAMLAAVDDPELPLPEVFAVTHHALGPEPSADQDDAHRSARADVLAFLAVRGWQADPDAPSVDVLAAALVALQAVTGPCGPKVLVPYADAVEDLARNELATIDPDRGPGYAVGQIVVGTVVFERVLAALRRLAQEHFSAERFGRARQAGPRRAAPGKALPGAGTAAGHERS